MIHSVFRGTQDGFKDNAPTDEAAFIKSLEDCSQELIHSGRTFKEITVKNIQSAMRMTGTYALTLYAARLERLPTASKMEIGIGRTWIYDNIVNQSRPPPNCKFIKNAAHREA